MKAVLLLSGGLDSYTAGAIVKAEGDELFALTIRYGQVHEREIDAARRVAAALGVARHLELKVPLSEIINVSGGRCSINRREVSSETVNDLRSRLLTPISFAPLSIAISASL